jgi:hypothetical protein
MCLIGDIDAGKFDEDEDLYYEKLGCKRVGSVFQL